MAGTSAPLAVRRLPLAACRLPFAVCGSAPMRSSFAGAACQCVHRSGDRATSSVLHRPVPIRPFRDGRCQCTRRSRARVNAMKAITQISTIVPPSRSAASWSSKPQPLLINLLLLIKSSAPRRPPSRQPAMPSPGRHRSTPRIPRPAHFPARKENAKTPQALSLRGCTIESG